MNERSNKRKIWIIGVIALVLYIHPLSRGAVQCGGLPIFASNFAAGWSYETPQDTGAYMTTVLFPVFVSDVYCSEDEAQAGGYHASKGSENTVSKAVPQKISFPLYLPNGYEKKYPEVSLSYRDDVFLAVLNNNEVNHRILLAVQRPKRHDPPKICGPVTTPKPGTVDNTDYSCNLYAVTPKGHDIYFRTDSTERIYYVLHEGQLVTAKISGTVAESKEFMIGFFDSLRPITTEETSKIKIKNDFVTSPK